MVCVGEQEPQTRKTLGEGDEESEVEGLTSTPEVLNPSPEGFSTINFPNMPHSALPTHPPPPTLQFPQYTAPHQAAMPNPTIPTSGQEDLIHHFICALDRLADNRPPAPIAPVSAPAATQARAWALDAFDGTNPEDL